MILPGNYINDLSLIPQLMIQVDMPIPSILIRAIIIGAVVLGIVCIVWLIGSLLIPLFLPKKEKIYEAEATLRFAAFLIDLFIISIIYSFIFWIIVDAYLDFYFFILGALIIMLYYIISPISIIIDLTISLMIISTDVFWSPIPFIIGLPDFPSSNPSALGLFYHFLPYIICYLYFIIFDSVLKGNTLGRLVFRMKLRNINNRPIKFSEVLVNNLGKSFFFLADLIIGLFYFNNSKKPEGVLTRPIQIRLMQRLSGMMIVRIPKQVPEQ